jgi:hypothetical protein
MADRISEITRSAECFCTLFCRNAAHGNLQRIAGIPISPKQGAWAHDQAARIGSTDVRRLAAAHGLKCVCEECSGTSDKSGFATAGILDAALPTAAQRVALDVA